MVDLKNNVNDKNKLHNDRVWYIFCKKLTQYLHIITECIYIQCIQKLVVGTLVG